MRLRRLILPTVWSLLACLISLYLFLAWFFGYYSESVSDAAMSTAASGKTRQGVEKRLSGWTAKTRESDHGQPKPGNTVDPWLAKKAPGYTLVRYTSSAPYNLGGDIYLDVWYDSKNRIIRMNCNR